MGKITKHDHYVEVELEIKDFFLFNTPLLQDLYKYAWMMLRKKAPHLSEFNQAGRMYPSNGKLVGRFYKYLSDAESEKERMDQRKESA